MGKKKLAKHALLALWLAAAGMLLGGCVNQISEREMVDLSQKAFKSMTQAPMQDGVQEHEETMTLYFLAEDGVTLRPVTRSVVVRDGLSRAEAALEALLAGPLETERGAFWPDLGAARSDRPFEVAAGVATVDLNAHARTLAQQMLYSVRLAITNTLTEFPEISYVNVLVGGREEGLDLSATLSVGTLTHTDELDVSARYGRLYEQRLSDAGISLLTTLYFPSADGRMILPQVRHVAYAQASPIEYLYTILEELGKGAGAPLGVDKLPAPLEYIEEMPEIVRTEDGAYRAIEIQFEAALDEALAAAGLSRGVYMAMLTHTLMGAVPGGEGLKVHIGDDVLTSLSAEQTPDLQPLVFAQTLATREDFTSYIGAPVIVYAITEQGGLTRERRILAQARQREARALLGVLLSMWGDRQELAALTDEDILAVGVEGNEMALDLSADFASALRALPEDEAKAAVYAIVNTLTEGSHSGGVSFYFEGEQMSQPLGLLEMRGRLARNPGLVVD